MKQTLKYFGVLTVGFFLGAVIMSPSSQSEPVEPAPQKPEIVEQEPAETQEVSGVQEEAETELFTLAGIGQKATEKFTLKRGLAVFKITHSGSGHFSIWLLDDTGNNVELLVNEIGTFDGSKAVKIPKDGRYLLDVSADGQWTVEIE